MQPFYTYYINDECNLCIFGESVTSADFQAYHICFKSHNKTRIFGDEPCKYFEPKGEPKP